ncbi:MAG: phosphatidylserine decarboxylase [Legionellales bacterium]|nr:phosphatidylserine decarboxylase [Legionellales bacterium]
MISAYLQYYFPQFLVTGLFGKLATQQKPWLKNFFIKHFIRHYHVDMNIALEPDYKKYPDFNAFFTRKLQSEYRPICRDPKQICSPVDGCISELGKIDDDRILQVKGTDYSLFELLGNHGEFTKLFLDGEFITLYLSPRDYHRVHMPFSGTLTDMIHVPGRLLSVNQKNARLIPGLFARNERVISLFDTSIGKMAVIMVGALNVGSIHTQWAGIVTPPHKNRQIRHQQYGKNSQLRYQRGNEMGYFQMGSTVILLFEKNRIQFHPSLQAQHAVIYGSSIAQVL